MSLEAKFNEPAESVKNLTKRPSDNELLEMYAMDKYIIGCETAVNTIWQETWDAGLKGKAKWEEWNSKKGLTKEAAMEAYVALAEKLKSACA
ncbi:acyl-CoA-binding protein homolog [Periplaneta americana]|uniref:acyl-CoA-binding protein homolog n=1 Tax=Periplaneta americana TaxID=6978 RepID=UPI0037E71DD9